MSLKSPCYINRAGAANVSDIRQEHLLTLHNDCNVFPYLYREYIAFAQLKQLTHRNSRFAELDIQSQGGAQYSVLKTFEPRCIVISGIGISTQYDETVIENIEAHMPALTAEILATLSDYTEEEVAGREARFALAEDLRTTMNTTLTGLEGFGGIEKVHLTSYVMQ